MFVNAGDRAGRSRPVSAPKFSAYASATLAVVSGTIQPIQMNTVVTDTAAGFSTTAFRYTCQVAGLYQVNACVRMDATLAGTSEVLTGVYKNGVIEKWGSGMSFSVKTGTLSYAFTTVSCMVDLAVGDFIDIRSFTVLPGGGVTGTYASGATQAYFQGAWIRS